jgi:hypothetical protein
MRISMPFKEYLRILKAYSNSPLTLNRLTLPFGIIGGNEESTSLLLGHVLDDLASRFDGDEAVDFIDVAATAYDLGHEPAGEFLDQAPHILSRLSTEVGSARIH